jgi:hypothetical protein
MQRLRYVKNGDMFVSKTPIIAVNRLLNVEYSSKHLVFMIRDTETKDILYEGKAVSLPMLKLNIRKTLTNMGVLFEGEVRNKKHLLDELSDIGRSYEN